MTSDLSISTYNGSVTVTGSVSQSIDIVVYLALAYGDV